MRDQCARAVGVGPHSERSHEPVGIAGGGERTLGVARRLSCQQSGGQVVARLGNEAPGSRPLRPLGGAGEVLSGEVELAEDGGAPAEGELDRPQLEHALADHVLVPERRQTLEQNRQFVVPPERGGDKRAVDVAGEDEERGQ